MSCPNCGMPSDGTQNGFDCGSFVQQNGKPVLSPSCKKISHLREMRLEALPVVQDAATDLTYKHEGRAKIAGLAKRIENEVNE